MSVQMGMAYVSRHIDKFVLMFFCILAFIITVPFIHDPLHVLVSPINGDAGYSSVLFEAIKREGLNPFFDGVATSVAYPDGISINTGVNRVSFFSTLFLWVGTLAVNAFFAHSLLAILGVILSAFVTYLFVRRVTGRAAPGLVAGLVVGFSPLMMAILFSSSPYTHMWLYVMIIWAFWSLLTKGVSIKRNLMLLGVIFLALFWTPYYTYHILLIVATCTTIIAMTLIVRRKFSLALMYCVMNALILGVFVAIYYIIGMSSQFSEVPNRTIDEIYEQSAHPLMYILPGAFTIFQQDSYHLLTQLVPRAASTSLYVGISSILIALFAVFELKKSKQGNEKIRAAVVMAGAVLVVSFLFSLAPTVGVLGIDLPTPNKLIAEFAPSLRAGQRLAMPVIVSIAILVGIGTHFLLGRMKGKYHPVFFVVILPILFIDLASYPPERYTQVAPRHIFEQLSKRPTGVAATYLNNSLVSNPGQYICYPQFEHGMPIVNDCAIQRDPYNFDKPKKELAGIIAKPLCGQLEVLRQKGVKYVIVSHHNNDIIRACLSKNAHYNLVLHDEEYTVYERQEG